MKESILDESKEKGESKEEKASNDPLMKPFALGWTREVVRRVITKNGTPNCDVYYFSPTGKKIRSMTEMRANLTDGLSPECFSFKRELLGFGSNYESIRDAKVRKKEKTTEKEKSVKFSRKVKTKNSSETIENNVKESKKRKVSESKEEENEINEILNARPKRTRQEVNKEVENLNNVSKIRTRGEVMAGLRRRTEVLKKIIRAKQTKQANVVAGKKILKKIVRKKVVAPLKRINKIQLEKDTKLSNKNSKNKKKTINVKKARKIVKNNQLKSKNEKAKDDSNTDETEKKAATSDLKSIVQKNIGKYREMREKQKLGVIKNQIHNKNKKIVVGKGTRVRSEPISKNKLFYLKPLEKGWRRELVFRTNCAKAGQQADVYYFHPSGKKLRSCREIAENLTHGLSIDCFTFRKEPIGCGEPSEVIRNARSHQKN